MRYLRVRKAIYVFCVVFAIALFYTIKHEGERDYSTIFDYWSSTPRLERPISEDALVSVSKYKKEIRSSAERFGVNPVAISGIIVAEASLHTGPVNYFEEYYVRSVFLNKSEEYLSNLITATEKDVADKRMKGEREQEFRFRVQRGLIWSIGLCQISIVKAVKLEPILAEMEFRDARGVREVIKALLVPEENVKYCALELHNIREKFRSTTGIDINNRPEIVATLYNTGRVDEIVVEYVKDKTRIPKANDFGEYIRLHEDLIERSLL